jgi:hypothetical protein
MSSGGMILEVKLWLPIRSQSQASRSFSTLAFGNSQDGEKATMSHMMAMSLFSLGDTRLAKTPMKRFIHALRHQSHQIFL